MYKQFHNTETELLWIQNNIMCAIDDGDVVGLILLDLATAFDTVDHPTLAI